MEATRRGIMGMLTGAAVAGPKLVESIVAEADVAGQMIDPGWLAKAEFTKGLSDAVPMEDTDWGYSRVRRIKALLRGGDDALTDGRLMGYEHTLDGLCVESLKSVSAVNKQRIHREHERQRFIRERRRELTDELARLLTGGWSKRFDETPY